MVEVVFDYKQIQTIIQANLEDSFNTIINKFVNKTNLNLNEIYFLSNGKNIKNSDIIENIMSESDKKNKRIIILVYSVDNNHENTNVIKSNDIICPTCKELCKFDIIEHKILLYECKNEHIMENIKLDEFNNTQNIDISQIKCNNCKNKSKSDTYKNEFFICCDCNMNLCPLCKSIHDKSHSIINYDNKNYICNKHNETFIKYCKDCNIDLCFSCINGHKNHKVLSYEDKLIDIKELRKKMNNLKIVINKFKTNLEEIINKFKKLEDNLDIYYNINNNIINNYEKSKHRNYNILINLNTINNNIVDEIKKLRDEYSYGYNLNSLLYLYSEINDENKEIELNYQSNNDGKLRIFGNKFVKNNINKCKIIYEYDEYDLTKFIDDIYNDYEPNEIIKIKLKGINNVTDMSYMFSGCSSLSSLPDIATLNTSHVIDMSLMFDDCSSLSSLPDISKWDISNVRSINCMFSGCSSLSTLPDISKWNTSSITDMSFMFSGCSSLSSLPDLSKWNTSNIIDMSDMFKSCSSLSSLPDI